MKVSVISGGTATNSIVGAFGPNTSYLIPVSDNGGSSYEIQRAFDGVAIGDLRSRIVRLVESESLRVFWHHRLANELEWRVLLNGTHACWLDVEEGLVPTLKSYLEIINMQLKQNQSITFNFKNASVGNLVLTAIRLQTGDLQASIDIMCQMGKVPRSQKVIACINTTESQTIAVELANGERIVGQNEISHPSSSPLEFQKDNVPNLASPIVSLFYLDKDVKEVQPRASEGVLQALEQCDTLVYSIGSLWTSLVPVLVLAGVAEKVAQCKRRVLLVNGTLDRETFGMNVVDVLRVIVASLHYSATGERVNALEFAPEALAEALKGAVDEVVYLEDGEIALSPLLDSLPLKLTKLKGNKFEITNLETLFK